MQKKKTFSQVQNEEKDNTCEWIYMKTGKREIAVNRRYKWTNLTEESDEAFFSQELTCYLTLNMGEHYCCFKKVAFLFSVLRSME